MSSAVRPNGETLLHVAAEFGQMNILEHLLRMGGSYLQANNANELPIHLAAREGRITIVKYFLEV